MQLGSQFWCESRSFHPVYAPIVITYTEQLDAAVREMEVKPPLRTTSAHPSGYHGICGWPNPVTGTKKPEYETGNVYVAGVLEAILPVTPCLYANSDVHTIPAVFSEICRCYFPEVSVMVTPATAINLS